ncbi:DUF3696 domain-containing protein [Rahnella sikkimica]|uniref:Endonuclease GajA/Old nuclease/RecF-like AAA domain-containing protein n=1 Tax=Rahnella sikkimica TaxID=1805933 RepID=A0A2L1UQ83_9GAMM|nr:DUF3696 domain-containing protein [Rahnella sikkimica]AVF35091.1 hypothetical protein BV494_09160 [Rahnella sikkimica]
MLESIGVNNFRSFKTETTIELKPITVFVGKNSSGKSSVLRTFPLFRQSLESNTTGPILWYGRYVDFGDFEEVISNNSLKDTIEFKFILSISEDRNKKFNRYSHRIANTEDTKFDVRLKLKAKDKKTKANEIEIKLHDVTINIYIGDNDNASFKITSGKVVIEKDGLVATNLGQFIPRVLLKKKEEVISTTTGIKNQYYSNRPYQPNELELTFLQSGLKILREYFHTNTDTDKILNGLDRLGFVKKDVYRYLLEGVFKEQRFFVNNFNKDPSAIVDKIYPYTIAWNLNSILNIINSELTEIFSSIRYIAPLRATSERFYRFQDLQVDEIDHTGSNLAMLLNSLKPTEKNQFEQWTKVNFGFFVKVKQDGPHFAVRIVTDSDDTEYNISDMGFGYSQVLPILTAIWMETERKKAIKDKKIIFIIEQPELHLHPAYQHTLAKIFAKVIAKAKENSINIQIIFETHSQNMIESLGECIEDKSIDITPDDISIIIFDKENGKSTNTSISTFDDDGMLNNWPIGFFSGR